MFVLVLGCLFLAFRLTDSVFLPFVHSDDIHQSKQHGQPIVFIDTCFSSYKQTTHKLTKSSKNALELCSFVAADRPVLWELCIMYFWVDYNRVPKNIFLSLDHQSRQHTSSIPHPLKCKWLGHEKRSHPCRLIVFILFAQPRSVEKLFL